MPGGELGTLTATRVRPSGRACTSPVGATGGPRAPVRSVQPGQPASPTGSGRRSSRRIRRPPRCTAIERYDDRLEDPSPVGRAARPGTGRVDPRRGQRRSRPPISPSRTGSPWTWSRWSASSRSSRTTSGWTCSARSTRWVGRRPSCRPWPPSSRPTRPERLERFLTRLRAYPGVHGGQHRAPQGGDCERADRAADRDRADDCPARAAARRPRPKSRSSSRWPRSPARPIGRASSTSSGTRSSRPTRPSSTPSGAATWRRAGRTRACGRRPMATRSTGPRSWPGRPWPSSRPSSTRSASTSSSRSRPSAR